jgi:hypothetical protein
MKKIVVLGILTSVLLISACQKNEDSTTNKEALQQDASVTSLKKEIVATNTNETPKETTSVYFPSTVFDFGTIKQGDKVNYTFEFENEGKIPLIITDVKPSCGCTTPDWTKTPIAPGEKGKIDVEFNSSGKSGMQVKNITVYANIPDGTKTLVLKGNIEVPSNVEGPFKKK